MDTSNSALLSVNLLALKKSEHQEDRDLAELAVQTMDAIIEKLRPILMYVTVPQLFYTGDPARCNWTTGPSTKVAQVYFDAASSSVALFIQSDGSFLRAIACTKGESGQTHHFHRLGALQEEFQEWGLFPIDGVIQGLKELLVRAEEKKREHLEVVAKRRQMLDDILKVVNNA